MNISPLQRKPVPTDALRALGVVAVYLFGSQAEGLARPDSDVDIGVLFNTERTASLDGEERYQALYDIFTDVFDMSGFRDIDIVFLDRASLELRFDVITHGKILCDVDPDERFAFEERTSALYRDFKPLLEVSNRAVLERI